MRILVVEDEPDVGAVFSDFLRELGHASIVVRSAEAALSTLEVQHLDAIILDINLPGLSGLDFLRLRPVRELGLPILAVSGVASESQARECLRLGAFDFIGKPVGLHRLGEILACMEPHALHRQLAEVGRSSDRRRAARLRVTFPVRVTEYDGTEWEGRAFDLSPFGIRVRTSLARSSAGAVKLVFGLPDGGPPLRVMSLIVRTGDVEYAFYFINLTAEDFDRVAEFTR